MTWTRVKRAPSGLGVRLKLVRESAGIDDTDLSAVAGLSRPHVFMLEEGWIRSPRSETILALSQVLGVPLDYLLGGTGDPPSPGKVKAAFRKARKQNRPAPSERV